MNWRHFQSFLWLRWRLRVNQLKRGGTANAVILIILAVAAGFLAVFLFVAMFMVGLVSLRDASPPILIYVWDGLVLFFLFFWAIGILSDLQRSEALSLEKFLHLPVSLAGVFLINYLSSLLSVNLILFVPAMVGLALGLVVARGPTMLLLLPLLTAFLLMITALTNQFQGWLAALMVNKRRRGTIIVLVTSALILICQLPNLVNFFEPWKTSQVDDQLAKHLLEQQTELQQAFSTGKISFAEYQRRQEEVLNEYEVRGLQTRRDTLQKLEHIATVINLVLPPGWLPLGGMYLANSQPWPGLLCTLGMTLIGIGSLGRSYRTTLRMYTGQFGSKKKRGVAIAIPSKTVSAPAYFLERKLPWFSEQATAIALSGFRSLTRAPEAKMMLLTPVILVMAFGSSILIRRTDVPDGFRPLLVLGAWP